MISDNEYLKVYGWLKKIVSTSHHIIHDGKEPLNTLTRNVALFMREKIPYKCQICGERCFMSSYEGKNYNQ